MNTKLIAVVCLILVCAVQGRAVRLWSHEELFAAADSIAIIEAVSTEKMEGPLPIDFPAGALKDDFQAWVTTFKVHSVFKGQIVQEKPLHVVHFTYSENMKGHFNGAQFIKFTIGPVDREIVTTDDGKGRGSRSWNHLHPLWLAYLKKRVDGRYEPISGQYDASPSFKDVTDASSS